MTSALVLDKHSTAEILSVSIRTIERMLHDGNLPYVRVRGRVRIPVSAIKKIVGESEMAAFKAHLKSLTRRNADKLGRANAS